MSISPYLKDLRSRVGARLLLVPSATGLVFDDAGRVLLVRHSDGNVWVAPGGAVDPGETPQDAVVREVWEETGLYVAPVRLCGVFGGADCRVRYANGDETEYVMAVYECRPISGALRADGSETLEARYVALEEMESLDLARWTKALLPVVLTRADPSPIPPVTWKPPHEK